MSSPWYCWCRSSCRLTFVPERLSYFSWQWLFVPYFYKPPLFNIFLSKQVFQRATITHLRTNKISNQNILTSFHVTEKTDSCIDNVKRGFLNLRDCQAWKKCKLTWESVAVQPFFSNLMKIETKIKLIVRSYRVSNSSELDVIANWKIEDDLITNWRGYHLLHYKTKKGKFFFCFFVVCLFLKKKLMQPLKCKIWSDLSNLAKTSTEPRFYAHPCYLKKKVYGRPRECRNKMTQSILST